MYDPNASAPDVSTRSAAGMPEPGPVHPMSYIFFGADGLRAGWSLLIFVGLLTLIQNFGLGLLNRLHLLPPDAMTRIVFDPAGVFLSRSVLFASVFLLAYLMSRLEGRPLSAYGIGRSPGGWRQFLGGFLWGLLLLALLVLGLFALHLLRFDGIQLSASAALRFGLEWALGFLAVALIEEYLTRGYLQFTVARGIAGPLQFTRAAPYARAIGFWTSAALFSFIFGFGHITNPGESPLGLVSAGLIGFVFCLALWRTGSLWWAIGFHAAWDWAQSFIFGVPDSGHVVNFHLLRSAPVGKPLLSGGLTGPEGSALILPTIALITLAVLLTVRRTGWPIGGSRAPGLGTPR